MQLINKNLQRLNFTNLLRYILTVKRIFARNDIEIDFLLSNESKTNLKVFPIEVKSSKNYSATSLDKFKDLFGKKIATPYIVHPKNFARKDNIICIPPYMVCAALSDDLE